MRAEEQCSSSESPGAEHTVVWSDGVCDHDNVVQVFSRWYLEVTDVVCS